MRGRAGLSENRKEKFFQKGTGFLKRLVHKKGGVHGGGQKGGSSNREGPWSGVGIQTNVRGSTRRRWEKRKKVKYIKEKNSGKRKRPGGTGN